MHLHNATIKKEAYQREFATFLSLLHDLEIDYCLLHPSVGKPFFEGADLDVYVEQSRFPEVRRFLLSQGWTEDPNFRFHKCRKFFSKITRGFKLKIDISLRYAVYGTAACFAYAGEISKNIGPDGYCYLDDVVGWHFTLKKALIRQELTREKSTVLGVLAARCPDLPSMPLSPEPVLRDLAAQTEERFVRITTGLFSFTTWLRTYLGQTRLARGSVTLTFIGLDGSGKTTYLGLLSSELESRYLHIHRCYLGYSSFRLPLLRDIEVWRKRKLSRLFQRLLLVVYLLLLPVDFLVRRGNGVYDTLLTDRHPLYEPIFDSNMLRLYDRLLVGLCPKPELVIYLTGDVHELWNRKRESRINDYIARKKHLDRLVTEYSLQQEIVEIDTTDGTVPEVFAKVWAAIETHPLISGIH